MDLLNIIYLASGILVAAVPGLFYIFKTDSKADKALAKAKDVEKNSLAKVLEIEKAFLKEIESINERLDIGDKRMTRMEDRIIEALKLMHDALAKVTEGVTNARIESTREISVLQGMLLYKEKVEGRNRP